MNNTEAINAMKAGRNIFWKLDGQFVALTPSNAPYVHIWDDNEFLEVE